MKYFKALGPRQFTAVAVLTVLTLTLNADALAGTGGATEFGTLYTLVSGWLTGTLGRLLAITFVATGLIAGVMRSSLMGFVVGIGAGLGVYTAPTVINNIVTAVIL
jgi:conjugal transfer pilus assembly protein TraA